MIATIIIIFLLLFIIHIFEITFVEGWDGYYIVWYKKYEGPNGIMKIKYSKRIKKFKE